MADNADTEPRKLGYWTISGEAMLHLMRRAHAGEDPDAIYAEAYANAQDRTDYKKKKDDDGG